uniref:Uncharacterized protein n=1 Tax=Rhizophora mucronata TaxID=61149 RepID=A0A2P2QIS7_RHIMU
MSSHVVPMWAFQDNRPSTQNKHSNTESTIRSIAQEIILNSVKGCQATLTSLSTLKNEVS